jgi:hypothetical protein
MAETELKGKKRKLSLQTCIICTKASPLHELSSPQDEQSWVVLQAAARVRQFEPILNLKHDSTGIPTLHYHRQCRAEFTHNKSLASLSKQETSTAEDNTPKPRESSRQVRTTHTRVYDKICIFCQKTTKYMRGSNSREPLKPAVDLRVDTTLRDLATQHLDEQILSITSRDIVAAEAQFHRTCYRAYTRPQAHKHAPDENPYQEIEKAGLTSLFAHIRDDLFSNPRIVPFTDLTAHLISVIRSC